MNIDDKILIVTDWEVASQLKSFCKKNPLVRVFSLDRVISYRLHLLGIDNVCVHDIIGIEEEAAIYNKVQAEVNGVFNELISDKNQERDWLEFIDANKFPLRDVAYKSRFQCGYFEALLNILRPQKVFYFDYSGNDYCLALKNCLETNKYDFCILKLDGLNFLKIKVRHFPVYINQYLTFKKREMYSPKSIFLRPKLKKKMQHNSEVLHSHSENCVLFSPLLLERDVNVNFDTLIEIKRFGRSPIVIVPWNFKNAAINKLKAGGIEYYYMILSHRKSVKNLPEAYLPYAAELCRKLFPSNKFIDEFIHKQYDKFDLVNVYAVFEACRSIYRVLFAELRPSAFWGFHNFSAYFRIGLFLARHEGIKTISTLGVYTDNNFFKNIVLPPEYPVNINICLPDVYLVTGEIFGRGISQTRSIENNCPRIIIQEQKFFGKNISEAEIEEIRSRIFNKLNIPNNSKLFIFAGQGYRYNLDYIRILSRKFIDIINNNSDLKDCYLLIRPHPREFKLFYYLLFVFLSRNIIVSKKHNLSDIISSAECIISHDSFAAIEAMAMGKRAIFLDWVRRPDRPDYFNLPLATRIDGISAVEDILKAIIAGQGRITDDFNAGFNKYFDSAGKSAADIISAIL